MDCKHAIRLRVFRGVVRSGFSVAHVPIEEVGNSWAGWIGSLATLIQGSGIK